MTILPKPGLAALLPSLTLSLMLALPAVPSAEEPRRGFALFRGADRNAETAAAADAAAPVIAKVSSGEHDGFSRLVVELPAGAGWRFRQSEGAARLVVDRAGLEYDIAGVFTRIPRSRLAGLSAQGNALALKLGCDCEVTRAITQGRFLVIDIRDPKGGETAAPDSKPVAAATAPRPAALPLPVPMLDRPYRFAAAAAPEPGRAAAAPAAQAAPVPKPAPPAPSAAAPAGAGAALPLVPPQTPRPQALPAIELPSLSLAGQTRLAVTEERLLDQIGRASAQGLLTPSAETREAAEEAARRGQGGGGLKPMFETANADGQAEHMTVVTAVDRELALVADALAGRAAPRVCAASARLSLPDWADDRPIYLQMADHRARLYGEFDRLRPEAALDLARLYLHFGFGAEARQMLAMLPEDTPESLELRAVAAVLDGMPAPVPDPLSGGQRCDGDVALWSVLSEGVPPGGVDVPAVQRGFARLPTHLRLHLGPRLSRIFAEAGDSATAEAVLRAVTRTGPEPEETPALALAQAALARQKGDAEAETAHLQDSVAENDQHSPAAVIELVEAHLREGSAVSPDLPELVAGFATELRRGEDGPALRRARSLALALAGRFDAAAESLADQARRDGAEARAETAAPVLALLADRGDDVVFLKHVLAAPDPDIAALTAAAGDRIGARLLGLGFADAALAVLQGDSGAPASPERRRLRAQAALAQGLPHRALVELLGVEGPEADRLRARAMWANGDYEAAGALLLAAEDTPGAARSFWLADALDAVPAEAESGPYGATAEITRALNAEPQADLPPLAQARALVDDAAATRDRIAAMLAQLGDGRADTEETATARP